MGPLPTLLGLVTGLPGPLCPGGGSIPWICRTDTHTFSRDLQRKPTLLRCGSASPTHGKSSPPVFFSKKCQNRKIDPSPLGNSIFFRLRAATPPYRIRAAATAAASENFGRGDVKDVVSHSVLSPQRKLRALCQRNSTELKRFRLAARRQSDRKTDFLRTSKIISRTIDRAIAPLSQS